MDNQETIRLHQSGDLFLFKHNSDLSGIPNIKRIKLPDNQIAWGFDTLYPQVNVTLTHLKTRFKVLASESALDTAKRLVKIPDLVSDHTYLEQFHSLIKCSPYAHQVNAILRILQYDRLAVIFEQGLGKTYIALVAHAIRQHILGTKTKMIVLAPKIVAPNWLREAQKYTHLKMLPLYGLEPQRKKCREKIEDSEYDAIITTYDVVGNSKSKQRNVKASKNTKLDFWLAAEDKERQLYLQYKNGILTAEEISFLRHHPSEASKKERETLWGVLKKIEKSLNSMSVVKQEVENSDLTFLQNQGFDVMVLDEASRIKGHDSARTIATAQLAESCRYRYLLSGTLCNGSPIDYYAPFSTLCNTLWDNYYAFDKAYVHRRPKPYQNIIIGFRNLDKLKAKTDPFMFSAKRDNCIDLPDRIFEKVDTWLDPAVVPTYNSIVNSEDAFTRIDGKYVNICNPAVKIIKLHQLCNGFIMPSHDKDSFEVCNKCQHVFDCNRSTVAIYPWSVNCKCRDSHGITQKPVLEPIVLGSCSKLEMIEEDLQSSFEKTIIWAWYQHDLNNIREVLRKLKINFIEAGVPDCDLKFQTDDSIRVFLGQESQGIGITLTAATRTIYYSFGVSLEHREQSLDRNYRIGQKEKVLVRDYVDPNTIEHWILYLLEHKINVKEFLQQKAACVGCVNTIQCHNNGIKIYTEGCLYFDNRDNAERKASLRITPYPEAINAQS